MAKGEPEDDVFAPFTQARSVVAAAFRYAIALDLLHETLKEASQPRLCRRCA